MISAVFIQFASYRWVFFFTTIVGVPASAVCWLLVPEREDPVHEKTTHEVESSIKMWVRKLRRLDLVGVTMLTGTSSCPGLQISRGR